MIENQYKKLIRPILDCYDKIRELLTDINIGIPKICVVGDQSSGKSSVLESISNIKLPRGQNMVTRCPIEIRLRSCIPEKNEEEYCRIKQSDDDELKFVKCKLEELENKIKNYQESIVTKQKTKISKIGIVIEVHTKTCPDLTLFDLPGISYEEDEIANATTQLIEKYTKEEETIVLIILPANQDLTTSQAINIVKHQKKYFDRTIPVVTKIDLAVNDKNIFQKLTNNTLNFKYSPIVLRNRTQDEIDENISIDKVKFLEKQLFDESPELKKLDDSCKGIQSLVDLLVKIQEEKLMSCKSKIKKQLNDKIEEAKNKMKSFPPKCDSTEDKYNIVLQKCKIFKEELDKKNVGDARNKGIATIVDEKFTEFKKQYKDSFKDFCTEDYCKKVKDTIANSNGLKLGNFFDEKCVKDLIKEEIDGSFKKCRKLIDDVTSIMINSLNEISKISIKEYVIFEKEVEEYLSDIIEEKKIRYY